MFVKLEIQFKVEKRKTTMNHLIPSFWWNATIFAYGVFHSTEFEWIIWGLAKQSGIE